MTKAWLAEIKIPHCFAGKPGWFNIWRVAIADMTGVPLAYEEVDTPVRLTSAVGPAPRTLPLIQVRLTEPGAAQPTPAQRFGSWDVAPEDPLLILLLLTIPGGVIRCPAAAAMAERLKEMREIMYAVDDGRYGAMDIGRLTGAMERGLRTIAARGADVRVEGTFEPSGSWDLDRALPSWTDPGAK